MGPDFDGHMVDFDELMHRNRFYKKQEAQEKDHVCQLFEVLRMPNMSPNKVPMPVQEPDVRNHNFEEVALGYTPEMAVEEATRCLNCKNKPCVSGCPVGVKIPEFIQLVAQGDFEGCLPEDY